MEVVCLVTAYTIKIVEAWQTIMYIVYKNTKQELQNTNAAISYNNEGKKKKFQIVYATTK